MKYFITIAFGISIALGQVTVVSTVPANNAVNVSLSTTITVTFNTEIDTVAMNLIEDFAFANIQDQSGEPYFSSDGMSFIANVQLQSNTAYFVAFSYMKGKNGSTLASPYILYFTTGPSFPSATVSGTVSSGTTGVSPQNAVVGLTLNNILESNSDSSGGPNFAMMAKVNNDGSFTIPYISNGTYWPLAAKDADGDGQINPDLGNDVAAFGDSIIVNNSSITGLGLTFLKFTPYLLSQAKPIADSLAAGFPSGSVLKYIQSYEGDTLGRSRNWEFYYYASSNSTVYDVRVQPFGSRIDLPDPSYSWVASLRTLTNVQTAASSATVVAKVETAGGKAFRTQSMGQNEFQMQVTLGDQNNGMFSNLSHDPTKFYWGVSYTWGYHTNNNQNWTSVVSQLFLCDFVTGDVVAQVSTGVNETGGTIPEAVQLHQNYPNPFNPTTEIGFDLPKTMHLSLKVYNVLGQEVASLVNETKQAGVYKVTFNANTLPSGLYFYKLVSGEFSETRRMVLLK